MCSGRTSRVTAIWARRSACTGTAARSSTCGAAWPTPGPAARGGSRRDVQRGVLAPPAKPHGDVRGTCSRSVAELDLDQPAAWYWPEFAAAGGRRTSRCAGCCRTGPGCPLIDNPIPLADLLAWDPMVAALAAQRPVWKPGTAHGYHGRTFGWLVGEVIRRVSDRSVGTFFAEEIAGPAGLDFYIGLPAAERGRVSRMVIDDPPGAEVANIPLDQIPEQFRPLVAAFTDSGVADEPGFGLSIPDIDFNARGSGRGDPVEQRDRHRGRPGPALRRPDRRGRRRSHPGRLPAGGRDRRAGRRNRPGPLVSHPFRVGVHAPDRRSPARRPGLRSAIRGVAGRSASATRRAVSRSATWSATSGRTWPTTVRGLARAGRPGLPDVGRRLPIDAEPARVRLLAAPL